MTWMAATLWDLMAPRLKRTRAVQYKRKSAPSNSILLASSFEVNPKLPARGVQARYDALVEEMKRVHDVRVRKWRKSSSGVAWIIRYRNGKEVKLIESPYPRGPVSCAIFLHEIGHHAIGLGIYRPRCLEEHHVWVWALREMRDRGFNVTPAVEKRMHESMKYAVRKAKRRGLRAVPEELRHYV